MLKRKNLIIGGILLFSLLGSIVFFWPQESPTYVHPAYYIDDLDKDYLKNTRCECIGFERRRGDWPENFTDKWKCYGIYVNCLDKCQKRVGENSREWKEVACNEI